MSCQVLGVPTRAPGGHTLDKVGAKARHICAVQAANGACGNREWQEEIGENMVIQAKKSRSSCARIFLQKVWGFGTSSFPPVKNHRNIPAFQCFQVQLFC